MLTKKYKKEKSAVHKYGAYRCIRNSNVDRMTHNKNHSKMGSFVLKKSLLPQEGPE